MKTYINKDQCPFQATDRVRCDYTGVESTVRSVEDDVVWCEQDNGHRFYRTWWHDLDTVMRKSGGGLTRIERALPLPE